MQQFQPLRRDFQVGLGDAGDVAARPVQAGDEAELDRIGGGFEHDRNSRGRFLCRQRRRRAGGGNDRDLMLNQVGRQRRQAVILALGPAVFDPHIAAVDVAGLSEPFEKSRRERRVTLRRGGIEEADHRHRALLGARGERPRHGSHRRAAEKRDDLAPSHCRLICPLHASGWLAQNPMFHL